MPEGDVATLVRYVGGSGIVLCAFFTESGHSYSVQTQAVPLQEEAEGHCCPS